MSTAQELSREMADWLVLELLQDRTRYIVDTEAGEIYSAKTGAPLARSNAPAKRAALQLTFNMRASITSVL